MSIKVVDLISDAFTCAVLIENSSFCQTFCNSKADS
jgi:hypothetical protein